MVCIKFWDDNTALRNSAIAQSFNYSVKSVNSIERNFLKGVDYDLSLSTMEICQFIERIAALPAKTFVPFTLPASSTSAPQQATPAMVSAATSAWTRLHWVLPPPPPIVFPLFARLGCVMAVMMLLCRFFSTFDIVLSLRSGFPLPPCCTIIIIPCRNCTICKDPSAAIQQSLFPLFLIFLISFRHLNLISLAAFSSSYEIYGIKNFHLSSIPVLTQPYSDDYKNTIEFLKLNIITTDHQKMVQIECKNNEIK